MPTSTRTDLDRLHLFSARVQRLVERRGLREGTITSHFGMKATSDRTEFSFDIGDEDDLLSAMTAFRVFTAPGEDTHFPSVCNLLEQVLTDPELREANRSNRQRWRQAERGEVLIQVPGTNLDHRACYDLWSSAEVFHADYEKERFYRALPAYATGMVRTRASSFVIRGTRILQVQRNVVNAHLRSIGRSST